MIHIGAEEIASPGPALFANEEWCLAADGLEHRGTGYFIARDALSAQREDGLWAWPLHLAEKSWCTPRLFREAFMAALERFGIARDEGLARSFAIGFGLRPAGTGRHDGFVALSDLVRPKSADRKRPLVPEAKARTRARPETARRLPAGASA